MAGEHDLPVFFALRTMDEIMTHNFMTFVDLMEAEHYDIVIGDEAWDVDYYYHENPELKRQPFVFLTDFVGCLPMEDDNEREAILCADRNADDIEHVARYPYVRDAAIFVGNRDDVTEQPFGPGLPGIRDWTDRNFCYCGYALPFDPQDAGRHRAAARPTRLPPRREDRHRRRRRHGSRSTPAQPHRRGVPAHETRGAGTAPDPGDRPAHGQQRLLTAAGLEMRPYVHKLYEHLACCDLALVQGGLSTTMELVATRRPFLSFPLQRHFEQCVHVRRRLANYGADRSLDYATLDPDVLRRARVGRNARAGALQTGRDRRRGAQRCASPRCSKTATGHAGDTSR